MRRLAAAVAAALLLGAAPAWSAPSPSPTQEPESPVRVLVDTILPRAPQAGDAFEVSGRLVNDGSTPVTDLRVQLAVGGVVQNRGTLNLPDSERPDTGRRTATGTVAQQTLAPGAGTQFSVLTTVSDLGLRELGVYPLDVRAYGQVDDEGRSLLGLAPTWVPYFPEGVRQRNKVAVLWPLVDRPRQAPDGHFVDDELATSFGRDGRLRRLVDAARDAGTRLASCGRGPRTPAGAAAPGPTRCDPVTVTYGIDPDLLSAADLMASAERYEVGLESRRTPGKGQAAAAAWLGDLRKEVAGAASVLALPYGDPDVDALARTANGRDDIASAVRLGNQVTSSLLSATTIDAVWPPAGVLTQQAGEALLPTSGTAAFVLDETAYPQPEEDAIADPVARTSLDGGRLKGFTGLVADTRMSRLLTGPDPQELGPRLAEQRFLAETAIVAAQRPSDSRTFLLVPPRDASINGPAAREALRDLGRLPWLCPVRLQDLADGTEACSDAATKAERTAAAPDDEVRTTLRTRNPVELSQTYLAGVYRERDAAQQLTTAVLDTDAQESAPAITALRNRMRQAVARAESTAWRDDPTAGTRMAQLLRDEVQRLTQSVQLLAGSKLLLTSNKGTLQVSIANSLDLPVRVQVRFTFPALRSVSTGLVTVAAKRSVPASVRAEAQRSGQFLVLAQIYDRDGRPFGAETQVLVRSTRYGRLALGLTIGAAAILFVAAGVRIARRALASPRRETE